MAEKILQFLLGVFGEMVDDGRRLATLQSLSTIKRAHPF